MKYADIAEVLDLPLNTVKSHIRRGKERLQSLLAEYNETPNAPAPTTSAPPAPRPAGGLRGLALFQAGV